MTFSYAKQSAEEQRRIALSMQPFYEQERANRSYEQFLARSEGKELGLLAAAISPDGPFGQAAKQFQTRRDLTNLANSAEEKLRSDTGSHRIIPLDELKERSESLEASYRLAEKLSADGADPETVAAIRAAGGQKEINLATAYVKNLIPKHNEFLADKLATDERWIQLDNGDKFQINGYKNRSQFRAAVRHLTHEFNQNNGIYGLKPAFLAETGYVTGYEKNEANANAAHGKTWAKDEEHRAIDEAWETNINNYEIDSTLVNFNTILSAYRNSTNSKGEKLGNKEALDEMFKYIENLYDLDPRAASNIADLLGTATYDIAGKPTEFSKKRVDALRDALDKKLTDGIDREIGEKERGRLLLTADFESGNIDEKEYNKLWTQAGYAGPPVGIQRRNANEAATPKDEKYQMLASIQADGTLGIELDRVHPENYEWAKQQFEKLNKFHQAKNHSEANSSIRIIDGRIGTIVGWVGDNKMKGEVGPTVSHYATRDFYNELKQFTLEGLPIGQAIDAARKKVLERIGNPETADELKKGYYYRLSQVNTADAYSVVSFKMGELGKEDLDFSKPWTGENVPDVGFLRDLPTSDIKDITSYVGPDYKGETPEIVNILFKKWKDEQPWFSTYGIESKDFARRLAEGLGIEVAPPTPNETKIKKVVEEATKDNELISRCIGRCTNNPSPGAAFEFKAVLQLPKNPKVANSNELLAWEYT